MLENKNAFITPGKEDFLKEYAVARNFSRFQQDATVIYNADNLEIAAFNEAFAKLFGEQDKSSLTGRDYFKLYPASLRKKLQSDIESGFRNQAYRSFGFVLNVENDPQYLEKFTYPVYNQDEQIILYFEIIKNNTIHVKERIRYKKNQELYGRMLNSIPNIMVLLFNKDLRYILSEGPEAGFFGADKTKIKQEYLSDLFDERVYKTLKPLFNMALGGTMVSHEMDIFDRVFFIQVVPIQDENKQDVYAGMAIFENITEDKINAEALKNAKKLAERANKAKSEFLANISHEIRTPLNTVIGFGDQLNKTELNPRQKNFLVAIQNASDHLLSIVDETITLSQVEAGEMSIENIPFELGTILKQVENILSIKAEKKKISLSFSKVRKDFPVLMGDPDRLKQILINLVNNAIKFTEKGGVKVSHTIVRESDNMMEIQIRVKDTGIGIPKEKIESIFKEYTQADSSITRRYGGSGLGLTISRKLIELQGGSIKVESTVGDGSEFIVYLPLKKAAEGQKVEDADIQVTPSVLKDVKLLVVDDDEMNQLLATTILESWQIEFDLAPDGMTALEKVKKKEYDVILMDIHMPGMSGMEVAQKIRKDLNNQDVFILAVTANVLKKDLKRFMAAGMDGYLLKPFKEAELFEKVVRLVFDERYNVSAEFEYESSKSTVQESTSEKAYDLTELEETTKGNKTFFNTMINTFIDNATQQMQLLRHHNKEENWKQLGEAAHKMVPSYRHLKINEVVGILNKIETDALIEKKYDNLPENVDKVCQLTEKILADLKKELK